MPTPESREHEAETAYLDVPLSSGWRATSVNMQRSPILLVTFVDGHQMARARADLGKRVFLDRVGFELSDEDEQMLFVHLVRKEKEQLVRRLQDELNRTGRNDGDR